MYSEEYRRKLWGAMDFACDCFEDCNDCPCCEEVNCEFISEFEKKPTEGTINVQKMWLSKMIETLSAMRDPNVGALVDLINALNKLDNEEHSQITVCLEQPSSVASVVSPKYYAKGENQWECGDAMIKAYGEQAFLDFCLCNSLKYLWRAREKGGNDDVRKAINYLNKYLEVEEAKPT